MKTQREREHWARRDQRGVVIPMVALTMATIIALAGMGIDVGYIAWNQKRLQAAVDSAALAGGQVLRTGAWTNAQTAAMTYVARYKDGSGNWLGGGTTGNYNSLASNVTVMAPTVTSRNLTSTAVAAWLPSSIKFTAQANAITVTQEADVPLFFSRWMSPRRIRATATATGSGGGIPPLNVAIIIDTTGSMNSNDSQCGGISKLRCALQGARILAGQLRASSNWLGLYTFPPVSAQGRLDQTDCATNVTCTPLAPLTSDITRHMLPRPNNTDRWRDSPSDVYNTFSAVVPLMQPSSYITDGALNSTSTLGKALAVSGGTCGLEAPTCGITNNTHIAQAIYQAQADLAAKKAEPNNNRDNVIILLSDGDTAADSVAPNTMFQARISRDVGNNNSGNVLQVQANTLTPWSLPLTVGKVINWSCSSNQTTCTAATITAMAPTVACNGKACTGTGGIGTYALSANFTVTSNTTMHTPVTENPLRDNQCQQAIIAANMAKQAGTKFFAIGYQAESSNTCSKDTASITGSPYVVNGDSPNLSACRTLQWMAGDSLSQAYPGANSIYFFSTNTGQSGGCSSINDMAAVNELFRDVGASMSGPLLLSTDDAL